MAGLNSMGALLEKAGPILAAAEPRPDLPRVRRTAKSERSKVMGIPTRAPVNRQAALVMSRNTDWLAAPAAGENPGREAGELAAELKAARNANAALAQTIAKLRDRVRELQEEVLRNRSTIQRMQDDAARTGEEVLRLERQLDQVRALIRDIAI